MGKIGIFSRLDFFDPADNEILGYNIILTELYREEIPNILVKIIRKLGYFGANAMIKHCSDADIYDIAIFPDVQITKNAVRVLAKHPLAKKQIIYYQNKLTDRDIETIKIAKDKGFIVATYNLHDAKEYGLDYNPQFWNTKYRKLVDLNTEPEIDVFFCGKEKGRYQELIELKNHLINAGLKVKFKIVSDKNLPETQKEYLSYDTYMDHLGRSRVVVDIVNEINKGLTIRPLEALFLRKKLITNYNEIVEYDFYDDNKENIFILDTDNDIEGFVESAFVENDFDMEYYSLSSWIRRFIES